MFNDYQFADSSNWNRRREPDPSTVKTGKNYEGDKTKSEPRSELSKHLV